MVGVSASVNLPLHHKVQKFSSGTGSPGWSRKKGRKTAVVWWWWWWWNTECQIIHLQQIQNCLACTTVKAPESWHIISLRTTGDFFWCAGSCLWNHSWFFLSSSFRSFFWLICSCTTLTIHDSSLFHSGLKTMDSLPPVDCLHALELGPNLVWLYFRPVVSFFLFMAALCNGAGHYIFVLWFASFFFFFFFFFLA